MGLRDRNAYRGGSRRRDGQGNHVLGGDPERQSEPRPQGPGQEPRRDHGNGVVIPYAMNSNAKEGEAMSEATVNIYSSESVAKVQATKLAKKHGTPFTTRPVEGGYVVEKVQQPTLTIDVGAKDAP